ncbi:hypothetical protein [Borreliella andersonii]|uniref:hypothetical protein n=1 Tax=Borrelia andersonii TaxID=42109 RepID=UPI003AB8DC15
MNKIIKMLIICFIFALIISCKNFARYNDVKSLEQGLKKQVKGFLDTKKEELVGRVGNFKSKIYSKVEELMQAEKRSQEQPQEQVSQVVVENSKLKEEIEQKIKELTENIKKSDGRTSIEEYCDYEEEIKKIREKLKELQDEENKGKLETELKEIEESLEKKKEKRKKELEDSKKKFEEFKEQVEGAGGKSEGDRSKNQGNIGVTAWRLAIKLGFKGVTSGGNSSDTSDITEKIIENALQKIDEELKKLKNKKE